MHRFLRLLLLLGLTSPLVAGAAEGNRAENPANDTTAAQQQVYQYRMKGKVRLLFFWVGKDDVGGGHIAVGRKPGTGSDWEEEIEVLFGSNPERVPGGINRWGYGKETGQWKGATATTPPSLASSMFEGFIKHSKEESLDEVRANEAARQGNVFWYDGIRSKVQVSGAISEIRTFPAEGDFDYRDARPVHCSYQVRLAQGGAPDKLKKLENSSSYSAPFGFLTGIRHLLGQVLERNAEGSGWRGFRPWIPYVYNANLYRLRIDDVDLDKSFDLPLKDGSERTFQSVAKVQFVLRKESTGEDHEFNLWVPTQGPYRGIPIRIVDKPRWWLRVELNLEPSESGEGRSHLTLSRSQCDQAPAAGAPR